MKTGRLNIENSLILAFIVFVDPVAYKDLQKDS